MKNLALLAGVLIFPFSALHAANTDTAANSTNSLGTDLYAQIADGAGNICFSPYSITCALEMTLDGAAGETQREMAQVLHLDRTQETDSSFAALQQSLG